MIGRSIFALIMLASAVSTAGQGSSFQPGWDGEKEPDRPPSLRLSLGPEDWIAASDGWRRSSTISSEQEALGQDLQLWGFSHDKGDPVHTSRAFSVGSSSGPGKGLKEPPETVVQLRSDLNKHFDQVEREFAPDFLNLDNYEREMYKIKARAQSIFALAAQQKEFLVRTLGEGLWPEQYAQFVLKTLPDTATSGKMVDLYNNDYQALKEQVELLEGTLGKYIDYFHWA